MTSNTGDKGKSMKLLEIHTLGLQSARLNSWKIFNDVIIQ